MGWQGCGCCCAQPSGWMRLRLRLVAVQVDVMYETYREESTRHEECTHPYRLFHAFDTVLGRCDHLACHLDQLIRTGDKVRNLVDRRAHTRKQARSTIEPRLGRAEMQHAPVAKQQHGLAWPGMAWHGVAWDRTHALTVISGIGYFIQIGGTSPLSSDA